MSLRAKITLILSVVVGIYALADNLIQRNTVASQFDELQDVYAEDDLQLVIQALEQERKTLASRAADWADGEALRELTRRGDRSLLDGLVADGGLRPRELDVLYVTTVGEGTAPAGGGEAVPPGTVLWSRIEDPRTGEPVTALRELPSGRLSRTHALLKRDAAERPLDGLLMTELGGLLVGTHPIEDPSTGQVTGVALLGRFLDDALFDDLGRRLRVAFHVSSVTAPDMPLAEPGLIDAITTAPGPVYRESPDGLLHVYATLPDLLGFPTILLRVEIDPKISKSGARAIEIAFVSTLATGSFILFVLLRLLTKTVTEPVAQLTRVATRIGQTDDTSARTNIRREDEIGQLSTEFDSMLEKLEASRREVIRTARQAGMSEIATGVLHNVGNVLNSVNVSTNLVTRRAEKLPIPDLVAMRDILVEHRTDLSRFIAEDPRGSHLVPFVDELTRALERERLSILDELGGVRNGVEHIGELVRSQQSLAGRHGVLEPVDVRELLDSAAMICLPSGRSADEVYVVREYDEMPIVELDRHKLMEVLVNLVKNALEAMAAERDKALTLRASLDGERVRLEIGDNGCGLDDVTSIFAHGVSNKSGGRGYGLHVSANSTTEMGGSLRAESDGLGHGATFVLELPARIHAAQAVA